jgi:penicillin-binding protein 2
MRNKIAVAMVGFVFIVLGLALFNLEIIQGRQFTELSKKNSIRLLPQYGARGRILDRNGQVIVGNRLSYDVMLLPQENDRASELLPKIARILEIDPQELRTKFRAGFVSSFAPVTVARNIDTKKAIALEELKFDFGGIVIQPNPVRSYPYGSLACHVVGYLNEIDHWRLTMLADYGYKTKDLVGFGGMEEKYDYYLRQEEGGLLVEVDHQGKFMRVLGFRPPQNGRDIQLTLDLALQKIVEANLQGKKGSVVIMDPRSGEILVMASSPSFNPGVFRNESAAAEVRNIIASRDAVLLNRAIGAAYPAGSVFKVIVALAALEAGKINLSTVFSCPGFFNLGQQRFNCWDTHGEQGLLDAIAHSCNVFFYRTGLLAGAQAIHDCAFKFGFSRPTLIDLLYEIGGFLPSPLWKKISRFQSWFDGDTANFSIGQGDLLVTPIQLTRMMAAFATRGTLVTPYVTKAIGDRPVFDSQRKSVSLPFKPYNLEYVRQGLRRVVSLPSGTASMLAGLPFEVAGKTGTVQVGRGSPHAWFVGFFPFKEPRYVICVFLEHGGSGHAAGMLTKQILEAMVSEQLL